MKIFDVTKAFHGLNENQLIKLKLSTHSEVMFACKGHQTVLQGYYGPEFTPNLKIDFEVVHSPAVWFNRVDYLELPVSHISVHHEIVESVEKVNF